MSAAFGMLRTPGAILFGKGQRGALGWTARAIGLRALACTDERMGADPIFAGMMDDLKAAGVTVRVYDRTLPELPLRCIEECVESARDFAPDVIIGVGGGSCLDLAKMASLLLAHGGKVSDYFGEFLVPGPIIPLIAIPTTSGTGSEVTPVAVIDDPAREMKGGVASPFLIPHTALCDPELTYTAPPRLTAFTGGDAMTHAIEAFTAIAKPASPNLAQQGVFVGKNAMSDYYALNAIRLIGRSLRRAVSHPADEQAREDMMLGALSAGIAFGVAGTAAAHALQYPVGHDTHTHHGMGVALLLPYVMEFNRPAAVKPFAEIARALDVGVPGDDDEALSFLAVDAIASLFADVGVPLTLEAIGLAADRLDFVAEGAFKAQRLIKINPRTLDVPALRRITGAAFSGARHELRQTQDIAA